MLCMNFSERIKLAMREAHDMSQAELARQAGVTRAAVVHWMRCEDLSYPMKGDALLEASRALRVSPYWLLKEEGPMRASMVDPEMRQLVDAFQRLPGKARITAVAQIKQLADLTSEKVNQVTAEIGGNMFRGATEELHPTQTHTARGTGVSSSGGKQLSFDEAAAKAKRIIGVRSASPNTEKKEGKGGLSR